MFYHCGAGGKEENVQDKNWRPVTDATPIFRRIHFSNITAREVGAAAGFIYGLPERPVSEVTFDDARRIHMAAEAAPGLPAMMNDLAPMSRQGLFCCNTRLVSFRNVAGFDGHEGPAFTVKVEGYRVRAVRGPGRGVGQAADRVGLDRSSLLLPNIAHRPSLSRRLCLPGC